MITPKCLKSSHKKKTCSAVTRDDSKPLPQTKPGAAAIRPALPSKAAKTTKAKATQEIPQEPPPPPVIIPLTTEEKRKRALRAREERLTNLFMSTLKRQIK